MEWNNTIGAFFELLKAGLWEVDACLSSFRTIDFNAICQLAQEQSVEGFIAAGVEHVTDVKLPQTIIWEFVGSALQIEQRNKQMNEFLGRLVGEMQSSDIYALVVKGQGIAQCYERPLWRTSGDIDFLLSESNYTKAKGFLTPKASYISEELEKRLHFAATIDTWEVELHGTLHAGIKRSIDKVIDEAQNEVFHSGSVRSWMNGRTQVFLPGEDEDVVFVFTHILQHFFKGGIGLRQICDWCRLLWTFRSSINRGLLESRLKRAGIMTEWKAFAAFAVDYLGMPVDAMPFYSPKDVWSRKANLILSYIIDTGNFGHNRDISYQLEKTILTRKMITLWRQAKDSFRLMRIFPKDAFISLMHFGWRGAGDVLGNGGTCFTNNRSQQ